MSRQCDIKRRENLINHYHKNPNFCQFCGKKIELDLSKASPFSAVNRKFCNKSCAAKYNNSAVPKRKRTAAAPCKMCGEEVEATKSPSGSYYQRKYCVNCLPKQNRIGKLKLHDLTKAEVRARSRDSQRMRIRITNDARSVYKLSGKSYQCLACGYTLHVDICHVKDIKDFSEDAKVSEINHSDNLITLCPTHHWEFDHGHWQLPE